LTLPAHIAARAVQASDRSAWLELRGIGGSSVAAIRGTPGAYSTAWDVWVDRQPGVERIERRDPVLEEGRVWEPLVLQLYTAATGHHVDPVDRLILRHPEFPWATGSPDGLVTDPSADGEVGGIEAKTARGDAAQGWGPSGATMEAPDVDLVPAHYLDQVYWYLEISGLPWWVVVVLLPRPWGMPELRWYRVLRNVEHQRRMLLEVATWRQRHIVEGVEPALDDSPAARRWLDRTQAPKVPLREATDEEVELVARIAWAREQRDRFESDVRTAEARLTVLFGDHTSGLKMPGLRCKRVRGAHQTYRFLITPTKER